MGTMKMSRRNFNRMFSFALAFAGMSGNIFGQAILKSGNTGLGDNDRKLVILRLNGGNDGLATIYPRDQYGNLWTQRSNSNILVPESSLLDLGESSLAVPSFMPGIHNLFQNGYFGIVQNVAIGLNRSHFRNTERWMSGIHDGLHPQAKTGWLGRPFSEEWPGFPLAYPNAEFTDPFAVSMAYGQSKTCESETGNFAHPIVNPNNSVNFSGGIISENGTMNADLQRYFETLTSQTNAWNQRAANAHAMGSTLSMLYGNDGLSDKFRTIARLMSGGLQSRVYTLDIGGFDTHGNQVEGVDPLIGHHPSLWSKIDTALSAFQDDLNQLGLGKKVIVMVVSEFGRQIASNASNGTDHGVAAPVLFMGECIGHRVIGSNPIIPDTVNPGAALPPLIDTRDVYASVLRDWFGIREDVIEGLFEYYGGITYYGIVNPCDSLAVPHIPKMDNDISLYPNPCIDVLNLEGYFPSGEILFKIQDLAGSEVASYTAYNDSSDSCKFSFPVSELSKGSYIISAYTEQVQHNKRKKFQVG